ncbi:hypothetical protein [Paraburkholderia tropica]|uniref:hypothetical protein n=1 Tax=Paraburkholderia tropica TaxID=92647 RepID=UPI0016143F71|nr:hypothetical protein [Paraburkholderia tropica]MBB2981798.1 hypothetical protein [Paraburkholderia tropica]
MNTTIKNAPQRIFLNLGDGLPSEEIDFASLHEVTWCADKQDANDVEYVLAANVASPAVAPKTMPEVFDALANLKTNPALIEKMKACMEVFSPNEAVIGPYHVFEAGRRAIRAAKHDQIACSLVNGRGSKCTCDAMDAPTPTVATDAAAPGMIAAAEALIAADRAQALTTEHVNALENAIAIQRGEQTVPAAQPDDRAAAVGRMEMFSGKHGLTWLVDPQSLPAGTHLYARAAAPQAVALTEFQLARIEAKTGNLLFDAGTHDACEKIRTILATPAAVRMSDAAATDAARYRWLRERAWYVDAATYALELRERWIHDAPPTDSDEVEQALDRARIGGSDGN